MGIYIFVEREALEHMSDVTIVLSEALEHMSIYICVEREDLEHMSYETFVLSMKLWSTWKYKMKVLGIILGAF